MIGPTRSRDFPSRGYSLVEVIIGTVVLTFVLAPTFGLLRFGLKLAQNSRLETLASQIITSQVENLRMQTYSDLHTKYLANQPQPITLTNLATEGFADLPATFMIKGNFTIRQPFGAGNPPYGAAEATITVSYTDAFGRPRSRGTYTRLSERGLSDYIAAGF
ncbi:MAG TPA: hypothetical protein VHF69_11100 [Candidatus Synoicihabitans sp.]|nr:hypothetical protein [Candidatus Synoicihabitans sp.]